MQQGQSACTRAPIWQAVRSSISEILAHLSFYDTGNTPDITSLHPAGWHFCFFCRLLRRLEDFVIYMPCIKLSTVITISIFRAGSLPQI